MHMATLEVYVWLSTGHTAARLLQTKIKHIPVKILNNKFWCNRDAAKNNIQDHHKFPIMLQLSKP